MRDDNSGGITLPVYLQQSASAASATAAAAAMCVPTPPDMDLPSEPAAVQGPRWPELQSC